RIASRSVALAVATLPSTSPFAGLTDSMRAPVSARAPGLVTTPPASTTSPSVASVAAMRGSGVIAPLYVTSGAPQPPRAANFATAEGSSVVAIVVTRRNRSPRRVALGSKDVDDADDGVIVESEIHSTCTVDKPVLPARNAIRVRRRLSERFLDLGFRTSLAQAALGPISNPRGVGGCLPGGANGDDDVLPLDKTQPELWPVVELKAGLGLALVIAATQQRQGAAHVHTQFYIGDPLPRNDHPIPMQHRSPDHADPAYPSGESTEIGQREADASPVVIEAGIAAGSHGPLGRTHHFDEIFLRHPELHAVGGSVLAPRICVVDLDGDPHHVSRHRIELNPKADRVPRFEGEELRLSWAPMNGHEPGSTHGLDIRDLPVQAKRSDALTRNDQPIVGGDRGWVAPTRRFPPSRRNV